MAKRARVVDASKVAAALEAGSAATGAFRSSQLSTAEMNEAFHEAALNDMDDGKVGMMRCTLVENPPQDGPTLDTSVPVPPEPVPPEPKKSWRNPDDELHKEATAVTDLVQTLRDMGITMADEIESAIASETNFQEMVEKRLRVEGEIDAMIAGLTGYIKTLEERVKRFEKTKAAIRQVLVKAFTNAGVTTLPTAYGTVSTVVGAYSLQVTSEALVPNDYFAWKVDSAKLKAALTERQRGHGEIDQIKDDGERAEAREAFLRTYPPIDGAELVQGPTSLKIRRK